MTDKIPVMLGMERSVETSEMNRAMMNDEDEPTMADDVERHPLGMCADGSMGLVDAIEMATAFPMDRRLADNMRLVGERARTLSTRLAEAERERDEARAEKADVLKMAGEYERWLGEILAVIHRDGGHYLAENGPEVSTKDAINAWADLMAQVDQTTDEARAARAAVVEEAAELMVEGRAYAVEEHGENSLIVRDMEARRDAIRALASDDDRDALAERDARIRAEVWDEVCDQWGLAIYGMTENGVAWLNEKAARELPPEIIAFSEWLLDAAIREGD